MFDLHVLCEHFAASLGDWWREGLQLPPLPNKWTQLLLVFQQFRRRRPSFCLYQVAGGHITSTRLRLCMKCFEYVCVSLSVWLSSVCHHHKAIPSLSRSSNERVGSRSLTVQRHEKLLVILQFKESLRGNSKIKSYIYERDQLGRSHELEVRLRLYHQSPQQ